MLLLKILFRNAFRHKLRTGLTILGIAIAILAFGLLRTVISAWYAGVEASSATRLVTRNAISLIFPLPLSYQDKIRQVNGVKTVSYGNWFGGIYIEEKNFFANFAVEPRSYLELYPEFVLSRPAAGGLSEGPARAAWQGSKLAERFGWKIGDMVTLKGTIFPGQLGVRAAGHLPGAGREQRTRPSSSSTGTTSTRRSERRCPAGPTRWAST